MGRGLSGRLPAEIGRFVAGDFDLGREVDRLGAVGGVGADEAAILYCSRITEHLVGAALDLLSLPRSLNLFSNLEALQRYNAMARDELHWAHAIRRLGNDVRHVVRAVDRSEVGVASAFCEAVIEWYFSRFPEGPRVPAVQLAGTLTRDRRGAAIAELIGRLRRRQLSPADAVELAKRPAILAVAVMPAVIAESLIDRDALPAACAVLDAALVQHPDQQRLLELRALAASRAGELNDALELIDRLRPTKVGDPDAAGILGGILKRAAARHADQRLLARAHRAYRDGWRRSGQSSVYLGINCATTALLLDDRETAARMAGRVSEILEERQQALAGQRELGFWDQLSLAEAQLLRGEIDGAYERYCRVFSSHTEQRGALASARSQALAIVRHLGVALDRFEHMGRA